jgi:predicted SnoaL-like aldol condensation-catalyzing enzyme
VKRIVADGDLVVVHTHARRDPADTGPAIVDIFRVDAGKLVEHWGVTQEVAESSLHINGMI